jgi:hypothetical protein
MEHELQNKLSITVSWAFGLFLIFVICACSEDESNPQRVAYHLPPTMQATDSIRYWINGGGNIDFTIADSSETFSVHVTTYQFEEKDEVFSVDKSGIAQSTVDHLESIFDGAVDIGGTIYVNERETGTWTYIYINNGDDWLRIANESIIEGLRPFMGIVRDRLEAEDKNNI